LNLTLSTGTTKGRTCTYDRPYTRGIARTPPPPPEDDDGTARNWARPYNDKGKEHRDKGWAMRSCDHCRTHQLRCEGKLPCESCFKERLPCTYKLRAHQRDAGGSVPQFSLEAEGHEDMSQAVAERIGPDITPLQFRMRYGNEEVPALYFLHKAWRRIAQALDRYTRRAAQNASQGNQANPPLPPAPSADPEELVLCTGDQPFDLSKPHEFPEALSKWWEMQEKFSIGWTETFHFIHRLTMKSWTDVVYKNWRVKAPLEYSIGHAKASIALMTMALGTMYLNAKWRPGKKDQAWQWMYTLNNGDHLFLLTIRLTDKEPGPPTLESVQARLLQTFYLLNTCRLSQAWYVFGNVVHMITALGLHRRRGGNRGLGPEIVRHPEYAKIQCERRTFWSAYILDKQISLMAGRPAYFNLDLVDQDLPDCVNDEDMGRAGPFRPHRGDCYMEALVEQAKLAKIVEQIMRDVYTLYEIPEETRLERAWSLGLQIEQWRTQLPFLMSQIKPSLLNLTYRRQALLLQLAHWHAQMLAYRPFLTATYPYNREKRRIADAAIRNCTEAARATLCMALNLAREQGERDKSHFHTILYAHHLTYCAAAVAFILPHVRERQRIINADSRYQKLQKPETDLRLYELANRAIRALVRDTNPYSPARRWAVILEELRDEAVMQVPFLQQLLQQQPQQQLPQQPQQHQETAAAADEDLGSPNEQLLEDALRAHWEVDLARESVGFNGGASHAQNPQANHPEVMPQIVPRHWDKWKTTDWLDLDSAVSTPSTGCDSDGRHHLV